VRKVFHLRGEAIECTVGREKQELPRSLSLFTQKTHTHPNCASFSPIFLNALIIIIIMEIKLMGGGSGKLVKKSSFGSKLFELNPLPLLVDALHLPGKFIHGKIRRWKWSTNSKWPCNVTQFFHARLLMCWNEKFDDVRKALSAGESSFLWRPFFYPHCFWSHFFFGSHTI